MSIIRSAAKGATLLIGSSIVGRAITFLANVVVARTVGRAALGVGALRLDEVMFLGPLQLVRDGPRKVSYRGKSSREKQTLINTAWVSMPVGILIALGIAFLLHMHPPNSKADSDGIEPAVYTRSIAYTFFGVVLAFLHEPMFLLALSDMKQGLRQGSRLPPSLAKASCKLFCLWYLRTKVLELRRLPLQT